MGQMSTASRAGRPRHRPESASGVPARDQILDAAAALFTERGFAATTTRMIAEQVGIRQASLYYHFATKDELLGELLAASVRPSLQAVERIEALVPAQVSAAAALYAGAVADVHTLVTAPHNIGTLYLLPEVRGEHFAPFHQERRQLQDAYGRLGAAAAAGATPALSADQLGELLIQLVEVVIQIRRTREPTAADATAIATGCLRLCGLADTSISAASLEARTLLADAPLEPADRGRP
jgi:AcrR family transcriptional regulator